MTLIKTPFVKAHGLGNDFLVVDFESLPVSEDDFLRRLSSAMCDRHRGVGADGVVFVNRGVDYPRLDFSIRLFNSDGSEAEMSGNGIRCATAAYLWKNPDAGKETVLGSAAGRRTLRLLARDGTRFTFSAEMGVPSFAGESIPFVADGLPASARKAEGLDVVGVPLEVDDRSFAITAMNVGNPQCMTLVDDFDSIDWKHYGRLLESHSRFPRKTNVAFVRCVDERTVEIRIWERGAGHTESSGTGSIASALGAIINGRVHSPVRVLTEGGELRVEWKGLGDAVYLTGDAVIVAAGDFLFVNED